MKLTPAMQKVVNVLSNNTAGYVFMAAGSNANYMLFDGVKDVRVRSDVFDKMFELGLFSMQVENGIIVFRLNYQLFD